MQITTTQHINYTKRTTSPATSKKQVSFQGDRLFPVNMIKRFCYGPEESIRGYFTRMTQEDQNLVKQVKNFWEYTSFGNEILGRYAQNLKHTKTYMIECPQFNNPNEKIQGIVSVKDNGDSLFIEHLQSASEIPRGYNISGAGSMLLYGITKLALNLKKQFIDLKSANFDTDSWYSKNFFISSPNSADFVLRKCDFPKLVKTLEEKYNLP